jgi:hypothetical protein
VRFGWLCLPSNTHAKQEAHLTTEEDCVLGRRVDFTNENTNDTCRVVFVLHQRALCRLLGGGAATLPQRHLDDVLRTPL